MCRASGKTLSYKKYMLPSEALISEVDQLKHRKNKNKVNMIEALRNVKLSEEMQKMFF